MNACPFVDPNSSSKSTLIPVWGIVKAELPSHRRSAALATKNASTRRTYRDDPQRRNLRLVSTLSSRTRVRSHVREHRRSVLVRSISESLDPEDRRLQVQILDRGLGAGDQRRSRQS